MTELKKILHVLSNAQLYSYSSHCDTHIICVDSDKPCCIAHAAFHMRRN